MRRLLIRIINWSRLTSTTSKKFSSSNNGGFLSMIILTAIIIIGGIFIIINNILGYVPNIIFDFYYPIELSLLTVFLFFALVS